MKSPANAKHKVLASWWSTLGNKYNEMRVISVSKFMWKKYFSAIWIVPALCQASLSARGRGLYSCNGYTSQSLRPLGGQREGPSVSGALQVFTSLVCQSLAAEGWIIWQNRVNKTKYFRLRLSDEVWAERELRGNIWIFKPKRQRLSALVKL